MRSWIQDINDPNTGRYFTYTFNDIVHSGEKEGSKNYKRDNPYNDISNSYDPRIDATIDWMTLKRIADREKGAKWDPYTRQILYPQRTLGAS